MHNSPKGMAAKIAACIGVATLLASAGLASAATEHEWSMDLDCTMCHEKEAASLGLIEAAAADETKDAEEATEATEMTEEEAAKAAEVAAYVAMHASTFNVGCDTCHADPDGLATGHKKLNSGKESKRLKKSEVDSTACTTCHQADKLAEATADYTGLTDYNGTTVNPHALPDSGPHNEITCLDCHQAHSGKSIVDSAVAECASCHHAGVYECGTCH